MTDNVAATSIFLTYTLPILGIVIAAITAFGVFYGPRLVAKRQEKKGKLQTHFDGIKEKIIGNTIQIVANAINDHGIIDASILRGSRTTDDDPFPLIIGFEETDEYQAFQVHYPNTDKTLQALINETWKHNKDVNNVREEIEQYVNSHPDLPTVKPYNPVKGGMVVTQAISHIYSTIYSIAQGQRPYCDFSKISINNMGELQSLSVNQEIIALTDAGKAEKCMTVLLELQNSQVFKDKALVLHGKAIHLKNRFEALAYELQLIYDYGLISKKAGYSFEPIKKCAICKRIFY